MKSKRIKKIGVLLVFSIFVSLISFNMAWAESKKFYFVLNVQDDWTYTLGDPATGSFTVDDSVGGPDVMMLEAFEIHRDFLIVEMMDYIPEVWVHFINGVPSTSISYFELRGKEYVDWGSRRLEMVQDVEGLRSGNHWDLYQYAGQGSEGEDLWEPTGHGNWFFVPKEYVDWHGEGTPPTKEISSYASSIAPCVNATVNDKVDFVVKGWKFDSTVERTPVLYNKTGEMNLLGPGGVLDRLYGLKNLKRIDNDQFWTNLDGGATAKAKFTSRGEQTLCYIDADGEFQKIFIETGNGFGVSCSGTIPGKNILPTFRWGLISAGHTWSSQPSCNYGADHMVTWLIKAGPCAGNFVIAWEDLAGLGDKDYQDLVVEINNVSLTDQIGTFTITAELTNTSVEKINIYEPVKAVVNTLEYTDAVLKQFPLILLSATEGDGTKDSKQTIDVGEGVLIPDESVTVDFVIGLSVRSRFSFLVDVEGCL